MKSIKLNINNTLIGLLFLNIILYFIFKYYSFWFLFFSTRTIAMASFVALYIIETKKGKRDFWIFGFFITYTVAYFFCVLEELIYLIDKVVLYQQTKHYTIGIINLTFIIAYIFLATGIFIKIDKHIIKKYKYHIGAFLIIILTITFCISLVIETKKTSYLLKSFIVNTYNFIILALFFISALYYLADTSSKSFYLLIGTLFISISEMLQFIDHYINDKFVFWLFCLHNLMLILGFYFLMQQIQVSSKTQT